MTPRERIFVALDTPDPARARDLARRLSGRVGGFKIGLEAFIANGPPLVDELRSAGHVVFLDLKLHDIPNTVAGAAGSAARLGVSFLTVHALGGGAMIARAVEACGASPTVVLAVTILTSHDDASLASLGIEGPCSAAVLRLARLAGEAGAGGWVCSPLEVEALRRAHPAGVLVVPGIRLASSGPRRPDDQARVATPGDTVKAGADFIVVGRPITEAPDPAAAAEAIAVDISGP